ncbi:MAG: hypothetical protein PHW46_01200 [Candidatus Omnitrophica bacterium]|nr:hypothetical protein [Candidatus Omnitrophota bacterium]
MKWLLGAIFVIFFIFVVATTIFAQRALVGGGSMDNVPEPKLISPITEEVNIKDQSVLKFKWSPFEGDITKRRYYDFRLYKGRDMVETTLIYKEKVAPEKHEMDLGADMFTAGETYTWCLRQVYYGVAGKSLRSFQSFRVIK